MPDVLRIGVIGTGYGEEHIRHLRKLDRVQIVGVCAASVESAGRLAALYGIDYATNRYEHLFDAGVAGVVIACPTYLHHPIALGAIARGIHVLCEKPLALTFRQGVTMMTAADNAGVVHATNYDYRNLPNFQKLHRLLNEGYIGEPVHCTIHWMSEYNADRTLPWSWRHSRKMAGFGTLGDMSHVLDDMFWHFGDIASVSASIATVVADRPTKEGGRRRNDAEDAAAFVALSKSGVQISAHLSRCAAGGGYRFIEVCGSDGLLRAEMGHDHDRWRTTLVGKQLGEKRPTQLSEPMRRHTVETTQKRFVEAIRDRSISVLTSFREGLDVLRLTDAIRRSDASRAWTQLEPRPEYRRESVGPEERG